MKYYKEDERSETSDYITSLLPPSPIDNRILGLNPQTPVSLPFGVGGMYRSMNPWDMKNYQEERIKKQAQQEQTQVDFNRWMARSAMNSLGLNPDDYNLEAIYPSYTPPYSNYDEYLKQQRDARENEKVYVASQSDQIYSNEMIARQNRFVEEEEKNVKRNAGKSKKEQYQLLQDAYVEQMEWERKRQQRDFSRKYSKSDFRRYLYGSDKNYDTTIDDLEVQLPGGIAGDYARKRAKFLQRIANARI